MSDKQQRINLRAFVEALVDERFGMMGAGVLTDYDVQKMQIGTIESQVLKNAFIQGRHQINGPYMTSAESDIVHREFNIAKTYGYVLDHLIQSGKYVISVDENGQVEVITGNADTQRHAEWALKIALDKTEWHPRWEVKLNVSVAVSADTPEQALEKAKKGAVRIRPEKGSGIEMMEIGTPKANDLRIDRHRENISSNDYSSEWDQLEAKYPDYVKPSFNVEEDDTPES